MMKRALLFDRPLYFNNFFTGAYGQRKPLHFFLMPSYWFPSKSVSDKTHLLSDTNATAITSDDLADVEPVPADVRERDGIK